MPTNDSGNHTNLAHFQNLIAVCSSFGNDYDPQRPELLLVNLNLTCNNAMAATKEVDNATAQWKSAVTEREVLFKPLLELSTRILASVKATGAPAPVLDNVFAVVRKIRGQRATPKAKPAPAATPDATADTPTYNSVSQVGYDQRVAHLSALIALLQEIPSYNPKETDLSLAGLLSLYNSLSAVNNAVVVKSVALTRKRNARNEVFYGEGTGMLDIAAAVKNYIKSVYNATSAEYKSISKIQFRSNAANA